MLYVKYKKNVKINNLYIYIDIHNFINSFSYKTYILKIYIYILFFNIFLKIYIIF